MRPHSVSILVEIGSRAAPALVARLKEPAPYEVEAAVLQALTEMDEILPDNAVKPLTELLDRTVNGDYILGGDQERLGIVQASLSLIHDLAEHRWTAFEDSALKQLISGLKEVVAPPPAWSDFAVASAVETLKLIRGRSQSSPIVKLAEDALAHYPDPAAGGVGIVPSPARYGPHGWRTRREQVEASATAALEWLRRHQHPDGGWRSRDFTSRCGAHPCTNQQPNLGDGKGLESYDVGVTGLAMLAFNSFGYTHLSGENLEYVRVLARAEQYLRDQQIRSPNAEANGRFGSDDGSDWIYNHAIATQAMSQMHKFSGKPALEVEAAAKLCLYAQNKGFGWRYKVQYGSNDTSVTAWMVEALKAARHAKTEILDGTFHKSFLDAQAWLERAANKETGRVGYQGPKDLGSEWKKHSSDYPFSKEPSAMTAAAVNCWLLLNVPRSDARVQGGLKILKSQLPRWERRNGKSYVNMYYWYFGTQAMFRYAQAPWPGWRDAVVVALADNHRLEVDDASQAPREEHGSWDPIGEWGAAGGRVYSTALGALTLSFVLKDPNFE